MFKTIKEYKDKIDKVYDAMFFHGMYWRMFGSEQGTEINRLEENGKTLSKLQNEVDELKKLLFKYLDVEKQDIKSEYLNENDYNCTEQTVKLVKKLKRAKSKCIEEDCEED